MDVFASPRDRLLCRWRGSRPELLHEPGALRVRGGGAGGASSSSRERCAELSATSLDNCDRRVFATLRSRLTALYDSAKSLSCCKPTTGSVGCPDARTWISYGALERAATSTAAISLCGRARAVLEQLVPTSSRLILHLSWFKDCSSGRESGSLRLKGGNG